jgi:hypothetical protein
MAIENGTEQLSQEEIITVKEVEIKRLAQQLRLESGKKLEEIQFYLLHKHRINIGFTNKEELYTFLRTPEIDGELIMDIQDFLLEHSFSRGTPAYVYQFSLAEGVSQRDFFNNLNRAIPIGVELLAIEDTFIYLTRMTDLDFTENEFLSFKVEYKKYKEIRNYGRDPIKGEEFEKKTSFDIQFDFQNSLCFIECGDKNQLRAVDKFINNNVIGIFNTFAGISLSSRITNTVFSNEFSLDKQTVVALNFLEVQVNEGPIEINDFLGVVFGNARGEKVKGVRLKGTNLLDSYEVADRIRTGDKIKGSKFQIRKTLGNGSIIMPSITIDFSDILKINFSGLEDKLQMPSIIVHIFNALTRAIEIEYNENIVMDQLDSKMRIARMRDSMITHSVLAEIIERFNEIGCDNQIKQQFIGVIDEYRIGG